MPIPQTPKEIKRHFDLLKGQRAADEVTWQEICDDGLGRKNFTRNQGNVYAQGKRTSLLYDNTMQVQNDLLAWALHNLLTSTTLRWAHLEPEDERLLESQENAEWFAEAEDIFFRHVERPEAGFHPQAGEVYNDLCAFGNGSLASLYVPAEGLLFQAMPLSETFIDLDAGRRVWMIFRYFPLAAYHVQLQYGEGISRKADEFVKSGRLSENVWILQSFTPNPEYRGDRFGAGARRFLSVTIEYEQESILRKRYHDELPIAFVRWNMDPGEIYGRGPGVQALSDQQMLSEMQRTTLMGAQMSVLPPMRVPDNGAVVQLDMSPAGVTTVRPGTGDDLRPLFDRNDMNVDIGVTMIQQVQGRVRAAYHAELLQIVQDPRMSPTQVLEIAARAQQILSPIVGRIQSELLEPVTDRCFNLLLRNGWMPPIPAGLSGQQIRIRFVSPVQRAQRAGEANALLNALNATLQLAQLDPSALDSIEADEVVRFLFDAWGVPPHLLRDRDRVQALRRARAEQAKVEDDQGAANEQLKAAGAGASGIGNLIKALQGGRAA